MTLRYTALPLASLLAFVLFPTAVASHAPPSTTPPATPGTDAATQPVTGWGQTASSVPDATNSTPFATWAAHGALTGGDFDGDGTGLVDIDEANLLNSDLNAGTESAHVSQTTAGYVQATAAGQGAQGDALGTAGRAAGFTGAGVGAATQAKNAAKQAFEPHNLWVKSWAVYEAQTADEAAAGAAGSANALLNPWTCGTAVGCNPANPPADLSNTVQGAWPSLNSLP